MKFGYDDNLGVPAGLADRVDFEAASYHDIGALLTAFEDESLDLVFVPSGSLPYLTTKYEVLAQATLGEQRETTVTTVLVKLSDDRSSAPLQAGRLGHINRYCTTSYWAPMIAMIDRVPTGEPLDFVGTNGFDDLLASVIDGRSSAAMVWDAVLAKHPDERAKTTSLETVDRLPGPVLIARDDIDPAEAESLRAAIPCGNDHPHGYFDGLDAPDHEAIDRFLSNIATARKHYGV